MATTREANQDQIERIRLSKSLRTSEVHRNLLQYLANKSLAGEIDDLKEYTIGLDVFAKPESYDPRQESVVRMHVSRLRQKLTEYYKSEGKEDPILVDVPKGGFRVTFEPRNIPFQATVSMTSQIPVTTNSSLTDKILKIVLLVTVVCALSLGLIWWRSKEAGTGHTQRSAAGISDLPAELQQLWVPVLQTNRPLMVCLTSSAGSEETGTATAAFLLGQFLSNRKDNVLLTRSEWLSMPELLMDNVVILGSGSDNQAIQAVWSGGPYIWERDGIRIPHPQAGEPEFIPNPSSEVAAETYDGQALISHLPGLYRKGDVLYLTGSSTSSMLAAVKALTDATLARQLIAKLRGPDGRIPRFYQVVLRVRSMDSMPVAVSFSFHREIKRT